jgi:hypothetical protein
MKSYFLVFQGSWCNMGMWKRLYTWNRWWGISVCSWWWLVTSANSLDKWWFVWINSTKAKFDLHASRGSPLQSNIEEGTLENSYLNTSAVFSKIPLAVVVQRPCNCIWQLPRASVNQRCNTFASNKGIVSLNINSTPTMPCKIKKDLFMSNSHSKQAFINYFCFCLLPFYLIWK